MACDKYRGRRKQDLPLHYQFLGILVQLVLFKMQISAKVPLFDFLSEPAVVSLRAITNVKKKHLINR
jgi:hypothetical protein